MKKYRAYIIIGLLFLLLLADGFFPFYSLADFSPVIDDNETFITNRYIGWESEFFLLNLVVMAICAILALVKMNKSGSRFGLIGLTVFFLLILVAHRILNSIGQHGGPFRPSFKIGYYSMLAIDLLLIISCFITVEKRKSQRIDSDLLDQL